MTIAHLKLGKLPARYDHRTLRLSKYIKALAPPPASAGYITEVASWPMDLNDAIGDCTIAAMAHVIQQWTTYAGAAYLPPEALVLDAYEAVSGYNPNNPNSDNGAVILDVLKFWQKNGIGGHKIAGYVSVNAGIHDEVKQAINLFGNCYIGIGLPISAQTPLTGVNGNPVWSLNATGPTGIGAPFSWGGHCVPIMGYGMDVAGNPGVEVVTWGQLFDVTWGFLDLYCDEAYALVSQDWIDKTGQSPSGFNLTELLADLKAINS